jgi:glyoxylase I family protein
MPVRTSPCNTVVKLGRLPRGKGAAMMFRGIDHVEIVPRDAEKTVDFYVNILGFRIRSRNDVRMPPMREVIYLELGDTVIEIISADNPKPKSEAHWEVGYRGIALEVEDIAKAVDYLKDKGIAIAREPIDLGDSFRGEIRDPDGLIIELRQWK